MLTRIKKFYTETRKLTNKILWTKICTLCSEEIISAEITSELFCQSCERKFTKAKDDSVCIVCGRKSPTKKCFLCSIKKPYLREVGSLFLYDSNSKNLVMRLKKTNITSYISGCTRMMINENPAIFKDIDMIVPIPSHRIKIFLKRVNQSALLAKYVAEHTKIYFEPLLLGICINFRKKQSKSVKIEREEFPTDILYINKTKKAALIGKKVLLVDDVITTGSTGNACASVLMQNGAEEVRLLTFARTPFYS